MGGVALASLFLRGSPIEDLNLDANRIGDDGGEAFAVTLRRCNTLLSYVAITTRGVICSVQCVGLWFVIIS